MEPEDTNTDGRPNPPPLPTWAEPLAYASTASASRRPTSLTAMAIIGIVWASLGLLAAASGLISLASMAYMTSMGLMTRGAVLVGAGDAVIGGVLAGALMAGSIGMLRLSPWSRRVLLGWSWAYIAFNLVFLVLQIQVVLPSQMGMYSRMFTPPTTAPATMPVAANPAPTTGPAVYSSSVVVSSSGGTPVTVTSAPAGSPPAQMIAMMQPMMLAMVVVKTLICLPLPIVMLVVLRGRVAKSVLS